MSVPIRERTMRFGERQRLAGIMTLGSASDRRAHGVVFINAGVVHRVGPDRLYVDLARAIALHGFTSLRFDLSGLGDSLVGAAAGSLEDSVIIDVGEALDALHRASDVRAFILIGLCSGANHSILMASRDHRVAGVVLIDPTVSRTVRGWVLHVLQRLAHPATLRQLLSLRHPSFHRDLLTGGASVEVGRLADEQGAYRADETIAQRQLPKFRATIGGLVARGTQIMMVFTSGVNRIYNYRNQLFDLLPGLDFRNQLRLDFMPKADHTLSDTTSRNELIGHLGTWLTTTFPAILRTPAPVPVAEPLEARSDLIL